MKKARKFNTWMEGMRRRLVDIFNSDELHAISKAADKAGVTVPIFVKDSTLKALAAKVKAGLTVFVLLWLLPLALVGKDKSPAPCRVYFSVVQTDPQLPGEQSAWLTPAQQKWYEKHGDRDKVAGICYDPSRATYVIKYSMSQETKTVGTVETVETENRQGAIHLPSSKTPVAVNRSVRVWNATGFVFRVGADGALTPVAQVDAGRDRSASVGLLKNGLKVIVAAEKR